ncbi:50S ribosomal protein L2 [Candidatus Falkowbacteria bacterium]|nr:50S ribosomal protein L2 [Candidatus Falkowbacteria bacterium]
MSIKVYRPISNARRQMSIIDSSSLSKVKPEKSLLAITKKTGGRNAQGKITVRHHGGGEKQFYRIIDFKRDKFGVPGTVATIEYDPNRTARIALLRYKDGEKRYIVALEGIKIGDELISAKSNIEIKTGNCTALENIPIGTIICNVELKPGGGAIMARSAGAWCKLVAVEGKFAQLRLPSSEIRFVPKECLATIGQVSASEHMHIAIGKAGRKRHMGVKPTVKGKNMNPVDHPHGGGEGHSPIGLKYPKTPWGKHALGVHTRKLNKQSNQLILQRRKKK